MSIFLTFFYFQQSCMWYHFPLYSCQLLTSNFLLTILLVQIWYLINVYILHFFAISGLQDFFHIILGYLQSLPSEMSSFDYFSTQFFCLFLNDQHEIFYSLAPASCQLYLCGKYHLPVWFGFSLSLRDLLMNRIS